MREAMHERNHKLALYTTMYPAVLEYLPGWYGSVRSQTDLGFELWIGLDSLTRWDIERALGCQVEAHWIAAPAGYTPGQVRQLALSQITAAGLDVVLVDSDDILHPSRVAGAREALQRSDLVACALEIVDKEGHGLNAEFNLDPALRPSQILPRSNIFGFSNSAYRCELLERCLPIPRDAVLADWFLATRAWLFGAELEFDRSVRMKYRQYGSNTARVRLPFVSAQVLSDTNLVRRHFQLLLTSDGQRHFLQGRWTQVLSVVRDLEQFERFIQSPERLSAYVESLNRAVNQPVWWTSVAYPPLAHIWKQEYALCKQ
jgi:hypothetical protein